MNMNDVHQRYIELLDENDLPVPDNPRYKPYLKQLILDNIPDVQFSRPPDKPKPEQKQISFDSQRSVRGRSTGGSECDIESSQDTEKGHRNLLPMAVSRYL